MTERQNKKLQKAIKAYESIDTNKDLSRLNLTLIDYHTIPEITARLQVV